MGGLQCGAVSAGQNGRIRDAAGFLMLRAKFMMQPDRSPDPASVTGRLRGVCTHAIVVINVFNQLVKLPHAHVVFFACFFGRAWQGHDVFCTQRLTHAPVDLSPLNRIG